MGENINCLASPFWRLNAENIENASKQIENLVNNNPGITIIYQLYDSCIFFDSSEEGEKLLPKHGEDGRYQVMVMADWPTLKKIFNTSIPLIRAGGKCKKIIISPLPKYFNSKCCEDSSHLTNFGGKQYAKTMGKRLADINEWLDDLAHGKRITNYSVLCPSTATGLGDKMTATDLRDLWGFDPVHLNPAGRGDPSRKGKGSPEKRARKRRLPHGKLGSAEAT